MERTVWDLCKINHLQNFEHWYARQVKVWDLCKIKYLQTIQAEQAGVRFETYVKLSTSKTQYTATILRSVFATYVKLLTSKTLLSSKSTRHGLRPM